MPMGPISRQEAGGAEMEYGARGRRVQERQVAFQGSMKRWTRIERVEWERRTDGGREGVCRDERVDVGSVLATGLLTM